MERIWNHLHKHKRHPDVEDYADLAPHLQVTANLVKSIESFGDYVVRQIGVCKDHPAAKSLAEVARIYLSGDKSPTDQSLDGIYRFWAQICEGTAEETGQLVGEFQKELDACMVSYFSFNWHHAAVLLDYVKRGDKKLRHAVSAATRKNRVERVLTTLQTTRTFSTLVEQMKAMGISRRHTPADGDVVIAADLCSRSPVLLMIGGGMGAGKSTVVKGILNGPFWSGVSDAVLVEADAFKEADVIYRALSASKYGDVAEASQLVHQNSTNAAQSLLVSALNEGRDVIFDGTMSWEPFVVQTIDMARDVHNRRYRMGPGFVNNPDGSVTEKYWIPIESEDEDCEFIQHGHRPYRIELVGVTCDASLAVVRGIRRAIITKRAVPVRGQLRSHQLFASSVEKYCSLVDQAKIFSTSQLGGPPELIGFKDGHSKLLVAVDLFSEVKFLSQLNPDADSVLELYQDVSGNRAWKETVFSPERLNRQHSLNHKITSCSSFEDNSSTHSSVSSDGSAHDLPAFLSTTN